MTELVMTTEAEVEDFNDELSDEAIDQAEGAYYEAILRSTGAVMRLLRRS